MEVELLLCVLYDVQAASLRGSVAGGREIGKIYEHRSTNMRIVGAPIETNFLAMA